MLQKKNLMFAGGRQIAGLLRKVPQSLFTYTVLIALVCLFTLAFIEIGKCAKPSQESGYQQEDAEQIREQTEKSLVHVQRAEKLLKEKYYKRALQEYEYVMQFYPKSIYAEEARQKVEELTRRIRPERTEKERAIISPSRLSFMPTPDTLKQGILLIGGGTSILGEFKAGIYDWLEVGLISGILVDVKAKLVNETSVLPSIALGAVAPAWNLKIGEVYGVAGKKLSRMHVYAGWSYIAGESAVFGGTKLILSRRSSILLEYNQPIFFKKEVFEVIDFAHNLNTGVAALRFIFPHNIGVETGIGVYTRAKYKWEHVGPPEYNRSIKIGEEYKYFLRFQLFWSVWL